MKVKKLTIQERADQYNIATGSKRRAKYRFTADGWRSMMTYIGWAINDASKTAKATPKLALLQEIRAQTFHLECGACRSTPRLGGAALTMGKCGQCGRSEMYGSTATPSFCNYCAFRGMACQNCGGELDDGTFL